ncbi:MAG: aspartate carbamoyltransferase catalytic subunit [Pseudomonadota bacterium]
MSDTALADAVPAGWEGILDQGEPILWQGQPDSVVFWTWQNVATSGAGILFAGFALLWMILASSAGGYFWMFGLIHFFVGINVMIGPPLWSAWRRRHTFYTLTDRRAFIATDIPLMGRKIKSYPIDTYTQVNLQQGSPGTIHFAKDFRSTKNGSREVPIGFERITGANTVYRLIRDIHGARSDGDG